MDKLPKFSNKLLTTEQSSGIHIGLRKVLQLWTINHDHGPMSSESWQKSTKGISDSDKLKYY